MSYDKCDYIWSTGYIRDYRNKPGHLVYSYTTTCFTPGLSSHDEMMDIVNPGASLNYGFNPTLSIGANGSVRFSNCSVEELNLKLTIKDGIDIATGMVSSWDIPSWLDTMAAKLIEGDNDKTSS